MSEGPCCTGCGCDCSGIAEKLVRTEKALAICRKQRDSIHAEVCDDMKCMKTFDAELDKIKEGK